MQPGSKMFQDVRRLRFVGGIGICLWAWLGGISPAAADFHVQFSVSPDSSQELLLSALKSADSQVLINAYEFRHPVLTETIVDLIKNDVGVEILVEANPVGLITKESVEDLQTIQNEMNRPHSKNASNHIWMMVNPASGKGRYSYDHAKYVVIDSKFIFVSSDNFVESALPDAGLTGYRGWQVLVEDTNLALEFTRMFHQDVNPAFGDIVDFQKAQLHVGTKSSRPLASRKTELPETSGSVTGVKLITSPNVPQTANGDLGPGGSRDDLVNVIHNAHTHLEIEMLSLPLNWHPAGSGAIMDPLVVAISDAAKQGAQVRVLLNPDTAFGAGFMEQDSPAIEESSKGNEATVQYLQHLAKCKNLKLEARIVDLQATDLLLVHNKGILADDDHGREYAVVGSINGTQGSAMDNREVALLLESPDASDYYGRAFQSDWDASPEVEDTTPCEN